VHNTSPAGGNYLAMATTIILQPQATEDLQFQSIQNTALEVARNVVSAEEPTPLSRKIVLKLLSLRFSFFVAGTIDGSMGPLIPYMLLSYDIGTSFISIMYEKPFPLDSYFPPVVVRIPDSQCTTMSGKFRSECPMIKEHSCYQSSSLPESSLNCGT
jgi:hypothetical protein